MTTSKRTPNFFEQARRSLPKVGNRVPSRSVIARMLGVTERTIFAWEHSEAVPQKRFLAAVASVLNVSLEELGKAVAIQQAHSVKRKGAA